MIGALAGDIIGSVYEWNNIKTTQFTLFSPDCFFTDDSVLTIALADSIINGTDYRELMKIYYHKYPEAGYGASFHRWARSSDNNPYNSWGNGAAMRISPVGFAFDSIEEVLQKSEAYTSITHNHPEGIKGAQATASAIFLARKGANKSEIQDYVSRTFGYDLNKCCDEIRPSYQFNESCQETVPEAITCFLESEGFESAIRLAISLGGDSDTLACITGGIAEAYYGVPEEIEAKVLEILDHDLRAVTLEFNKKRLRPLQQASRNSG
jgi:ADP-ribosylglycohydrolase